MPGDDIVVVHRSDGSGTTYIWTDYLSKISPEWKQKVGKATSVNWPVGLGGKGNEGVAGLVEQTPDARWLHRADLRDSEQDCLRKCEEFLGRVREGGPGQRFGGGCGRGEDHARRFPRFHHEPRGNKAAYPIASFTWLLIPRRFTDAAKRDAVKDFLKWMMTDGQQYCEALAYAKLPKEVVAKEMKAIAKIQ